MKPGLNLTDSSAIGKFKGVATVLLVLTIIIIVFIILNKFMKFGSGTLEAIGLKDSAKENEYEKIIEKTVNTQLNKGAASYWSPKFYQTLNIPENTVRLNQLGIDKVSTAFWDSVGYVYDSPAKGLAAVKMVNSGYQLSQVVNGFANKYGLDLLGWLQNKYDTEEQKQILTEILKYSASLKPY